MADNFNIPKILIAPLDWGLGHATRCIPLIHSFLQHGCQVVIAASGNSKKVLQDEFPKLELVDLKGYQISYSKSKNTFAWKIISQIPKILSVIKYEHQWLDSIIDEHKIDIVISDNRYGLYSQKATCVFITHQLQIKSSFRWIEKLLQRKNYEHIERFNYCWIPGVKNEPNLSGDLSHPKLLPNIPVSYIGLLSRFQYQKQLTKYKYCFALSGPEPQRTILEEIIIRDIEKIKEPCLILRGLPNTENEIIGNEFAEIKNHLSSNQLEQAFQQSEYIICRGGYTTLMEMISLQKKIIIVPTPGQTEQEYLAKRCMQQQWCYSVEQSNFHLLNDLEKAKAFKYQIPVFDKTSLSEFVHQFLQSLA